MDIGYSSETQRESPSPWFVLLQFLGIYSNALLAIVGIAVLVDRLMPGRTVVAELTVGAATLVWIMLMRKLGVMPKPRRPKNGARAVTFVSMFVSYSSFLLLFDWWELAPHPNWERRIVDVAFTGLLFAGLMSVSEKGIWRDESTRAAS